LQQNVSTSEAHRVKLQIFDQSKFISTHL